MVVFVSCYSSRFAVGPNDNYFKMNVDLTSNESKVNLKCLSYLSADSNIVSVYGPLGINVLKVFSKYDSLTIIDIQNKRKYLAKVYNASGSLYNFFNGKFEYNEKHILCTLCSLFVKELKCSNSDALETMFNYQLNGRKNHQYINCKFNSAGEVYTAKIKLTKDNNNQSVSFNTGKYINFETVYLTLQ